MTQFFFRKVKGRIHQSGQQGKIQMGIIHQHQQVAENDYFLLFKEAAFSIKEDRNAPFLQQIRQFRSVGADLRHQDHHILISVLLFLSHLPDLFRRMIRDSFQSCLLLAHIQQIHHHGYMTFTVSAASPQLIRRRIFQVRSLFPHDVPENDIGCFQDFRTGTEVLLQENTLSRVRSLIRNPGKKQLRIGLAESIDALLYIPDHKQGIFFPGQRLDQSILDRGNVLAFIHKYPLITAPDRFPDCFVLKNCQGFMFQIGKIQHTGSGFILFIGQMGFFRNSRKASQGISDFRKLPCDFLMIRQNPGLQFAADILQLFPVILVPFFPVNLPVIQVSQNRSFAETFFQFVTADIFSVSPAAKRLHPFLILNKDRTVSFLFFIFIKHIRLLPQDNLKPQDFFIDHPGYRPEPGMIPVHIQRNVLSLRFQPAEGIRKTHNKAPDRCDNCPGFSRFILPDEGQVICIFFIPQFVARLSESVRKQLFPLGAGTDLEERIHSDNLELLPDQMLAEGMDRADFHGRRFFRS